MDKKKIDVSVETHKQLNKIKEENGLKTYEETIQFVLKGKEQTEKERLPENPDSVELVLSEAKNDESGKDLQELFSNDNIEKKADISARQVMAISKAKTFADRYDNKVLDDFITRYVIYSVSKERKGRKEFVESFKAKILEPLGLGNMMQGGESNDNTSKTGK